MAVYHVSKHASASNSNGGTNATTDAWATITASVVKLVPGDILDIHVGTYDEDVAPGGAGGVSWVTGTSGAHITIRAFNHSDSTTRGVTAGTDAVIIRGTANSCVSFNKNDVAYLDFQGIVLDGTNIGTGATQCLTLNNDAANITWRNFVLQNSPWSGALLSNSNGDRTTDLNNVFQYGHVTAIGNQATGSDGHAFYIKTRGNIFEFIEIDTIRNSAIHLFDTSDHGLRGPRNNTIRYCNMHSNNVDWSGVQLAVVVSSYAVGNKIHNNLMYDYQVANAAGVSMTSTIGAHDNLIYQNTIVDINGQGIRITHSANTGNELKNNLIYDVTGAPIQDSGTGTQKSNNFLDTANPNFTGYTAGSAWDLTLTETTPTIIKEGGVDLGAAYYDDYAGTTRSGTFSIGGYASASAPPDPPVDPVIVEPGILNVTIDVNRTLEDILVQDNNDPDVGDYSMRVVVLTGTLNDGV